jgi:signal transduction histidine kinase
MSYRNSLRLRILISFMITGAALGPLLTTLLLWVTYTLEERAVMKTANTRLQAIVAAPEEFTLWPVPGPVKMQVLTNLNISHIPQDIALLPDGLHEYEPGDDTWIVAVRTTPEGRYAVAEDITTLEQREHVGVIVVAVATTLAIYLALWLGFYLSRYLLAPLTRLSERVASAGPSAIDTPLAQDFANNEIGSLAATLDQYAHRMREALRREREFSADVSHELRNPLAVIQNAAELIEEDGDASAQSRRAAVRVREAARRLSETVSVLLVLAREDLAVPPDEDPVPVADCVETLLQDDRMLTGVEGMPRIQWRCEGDPKVKAPRAVIEAIASNLIRNALQHSRAGIVEVQLAPDRLVVTDNGIGLPPEDIPRLFERGARGTTAMGIGFGLGLSLVQRLCDRFGWKLHIESHPGASTCVEWRFGERLGSLDGQASPALDALAADQ